MQKGAKARSNPGSLRSRIQPKASRPNPHRTKEVRRSYQGEAQIGHGAEDQVQEQRSAKDRSGKTQAPVPL